MIIKGKLSHIIPFEELHLNDPKYYEWLTDFEVIRYIGREHLRTGLFSRIYWPVRS